MTNEPTTQATEPEQTPASQPTAKPKSRAAAFFLTPVLLLMLCGGICILGGIAPYQKLKTYLNIAFMDTLKTSPDTAMGLNIQDKEIATDYSGQTSTQGEPVIPEFGAQFAVLQCDAISMTVPVYWGSSAELLERGVCQSANSTLPGGGGNAVMDAHVNTFFADLKDVKVGDTVVVLTDYGKFTYTVRETISFDKTDKTYVLPTETDQLTLYTCVMQMLGSSTERIGVRCDLTDKQFYAAQ